MDKTTQQQIQRIHGKLLVDLNDTVIQNDASYNNIKAMMLSLSNIKPGVFANCSTLYDKLKLLGSRGHLGPGNYETIRGVMESAEQIEAVELIDKADREIKELKALIDAPQPVALVAQVRNNAASGRTEMGTSGMGRPSLNAGPSTSTSEADPGVSNGIKKRKYENEGEVDEEDVLTLNINGRRFYNHRDKTGYLLILEQRENRNGSHFDTVAFVSFFERLSWHVFDIRKHENEDFTREQFMNRLQEAADHLNSNHGREYYCFMCVIMTHGNTKGLYMKDGEFVTPEEIRKCFTNDKIKNFTGKAKVFLIQSCRGSAAQGSEEVDEDDDADVDVDEDDAIIHVPHDADTLMAFATTEGYKSHRKTQSKTSRLGSWFLQSCIEVFQSDHQSSHLEDMLVTVRDGVARKRRTTDGASQMPCVWTTLTKRLMLH